MEPKGNLLDSSIQYVKGVGPKLATLLGKKGISTIEDALYFLPRTYEDRRQIVPINRLVPNTAATVMGHVTKTSARPTRGRKRRFEVTLSDDTGSIQLFWFSAYPYQVQEFATGKRVLAYGEVRFFGGMAQIVHPEYEVVKEFQDGRPNVSASFGRIVPIYSETEGLYQKTLRRVMGEVLRASLNHLDDPLPPSMKQRLGLPNLRDSFVSIHFPQELPDPKMQAAAIKRIIFEEFFVLQLGLGLKKKAKKLSPAPILEDKENLVRFIDALPFTLTPDQQAAIAVIQRDLKAGVPMARLLQGDVGSGKTVVAVAAAVIAASTGFQTVIMAPTEILALQHHKTAEQILSHLNIPFALVTQSTSKDPSTRQAIQLGETKLIIGTHAVFQKSIEFDRLGLVVVDEQHRFGVEQRGELVRKGKELAPHLLMMTATPIPRTLSLTLYGDLDLTLIRQKPAGRKPVRTRIIFDRDRPKLYQAIRERVEKKEQVYIIYPLVEASEKLELKSATEMYGRLQREVFPQYKLALLHGRLKSTEKETILREFKAGKYQVLVSTTVIEVGIDVPNATLMVIEHPERLGLSQLHQLRGRVGRGEVSSECILIAERFVTERLKVMTKTDDGFEIAEEDLRIRGPGEFLGTRQSGLPGFRVGHILRDASLLCLAQEESRRILEQDPDLRAPEHQAIKKMVQTRWRGKLERLKSG